MGLLEVVNVRSSLTVVVLTALMISGTAMTAVTSANPIGFVYAQQQQDRDGDGLSNTWETDGVDINNDNRIDYRITGADPNHKNLYVELDYMTGHRPVGGNGTESAMQDVISAFSRAPVSNPDGRNGITLTIQLSDEIPHQNLSNFTQVQDTTKNTWFGMAAERNSQNAANLLAAKRLVYHYALFAHQDIESPTSTGIGNIRGMNFMMTLGEERPNGFDADPVTKHGGYGTRHEQAYDFMHELGHNLGLRHGGNENVNCKNNYISVMNYLFSMGQYAANNTLDFSRSALATLNESNLAEPNGISSSDPPGLKTPYGPNQPGKGTSVTATGIPVDWNFNGETTDLNVVSDINADLGGSSCGIPNQILNGFNDWGASLQYVTPAEQLNGLTTLQGTGERSMNQAVEVPNDEITSDDIVLARLNLLTGIDNAILRVENLSGTEMAAVEFNTTGIAEDLQSGQLDAAIAQLLVLRSQVIEEFGEAANREVVPLIDNLVGVLENQKYPTPPPASVCTGAGSANTRIIGTPDPDTLIGTSGLNTINGLERDDRINGCGGNDRIMGSTGDDGMAGGSGNDDLNGNDGDDVMRGDEGNDQLSGGAGINTLTGGPGRDSFICSPNSETTITDFEPSVDRMSGPCLLADATPSAGAGAEMSTSSSIPLEILPLPLPI